MTATQLGSKIMSRAINPRCHGNKHFLHSTKHTKQKGVNGTRWHIPCKIYQPKHVSKIIPYQNCKVVNNQWLDSAGCPETDVCVVQGQCVRTAWRPAEGRTLFMMSIKPLTTSRIGSGDINASFPNEGLFFIVSCTETAR